MAWIKVINSEDTGVPVEFWEVISIFYDHKYGESKLMVGGWFNKDQYDSGKNAVKVKEYIVPNGTNPQLAVAAASFIAGYARSQPEFEGSEDVE